MKPQLPEENKAARLEANAAWAIRNKESRKAYRAQWYQENKERIRAKSKIYARECVGARQREKGMFAPVEMP